MNRYLLVFIALLACSNVMYSSDHKYIINVADEHQTHEGWGVSLCWWANMCGKWPDDKINELVDWLVSPDGLNYNIFRYNIGGGDDPNHANCTEHHMGSGKGLRAEMEGFEPYAYITTGDSDGKTLAYDLSGKRISFTLEPQSIATIVLPIMKYSDDYTCLPIVEGAAYALIPQYNKAMLLYGSLGHYDGIPRIDYINNENTWNSTHVSGNQVWTFHRHGDGYKVKSSYWDEYLTNNDEYWLHVEWWKDDNSQDFYVEPIFGNLVKIISNRDGKALDLQDEKSDPGTNVGLWDYGWEVTNGHRNWYLMRLPENSELNDVELLSSAAPFSVGTSSGALNIRCSIPTTVDVYGIDGRRVAAKTIDAAGAISLAKGVYIYKATAGKCQRTGKVIIR